MLIYRILMTLGTLFFLNACTLPHQNDLVINNGLIYDGSGSPPYKGVLVINGDTITAIDSKKKHQGRTEIDANGLAVAPGFINMLSWATESLIQDGRSQSNILQGVTLEIFGEGSSMGPLNESMKQQIIKSQGDIKYDLSWTTLNEYLEYLVKRGVSPNVASFVGATTVRVYVLGYDNRPPTTKELVKMKNLVRQAMEDGALGLGSSLIYAPAFYAETEELIALAKIVSEYDGMYISHLRSEGNQLNEALEELLDIARSTGVRSEIYHLKAAGQQNWHKLDILIKTIDEARAEGIKITANMYTYTAAATGLDASMPPWVQEGGHKAWVERLKDPSIRKKVLQEMSTPSNQWENLYLAAGSPENILLVGFKNKSLKDLTGKTLSQIANTRGQSPQETAIDLVIEDNSKVSAVYFLMSEENISRKITLPWMSFGSDAASLAPEGVFLNSNPHPRAYGNFSRLLGKYVRKENLISLEEAIRKLTSLPASNLRLEKRGVLKPGYFADVVVFDPQKIQDQATFDNPHQYSKGMIHVLVNGQQVLKNGIHTGAKPGRVIRGPGWKK